jgi:hypothetical protein
MRIVWIRIRVQAEKTIKVGDKMSKIDASVLRNWNNGEVMGEADYEQEREIIRTAINDNYDRLIKKYEVLNSDGTLKTTQNLTTAINYLKFKEGASVSLVLDNTTSTLTIAVTAGSVGTIALTDLSVTTAKIADGNVTTIKFADGSVTTAKIANGAIDLTKVNTTSLDSRYYTETEVDNKLNNATFTKTVQAGTAFPAGPYNDGQEFYRNDLKILFVYDVLSNAWLPSSGVITADRIGTDVANLSKVKTEVTVTHNLNAYPLVRAMTPNSFGHFGFGESGLAEDTIKVQIPVKTEYIDSNKILLVFDEEFIGGNTVTAVDTTNFTVNFPDESVTVELKLI